MKTIAAAFIAFTALLYACQNEQKISEVEKTRLELEAKRHELKEKKELAAMNEELKNLEAEIGKAGGETKTQTADVKQGYITGENVIMRAGASVQSSKLGNFDYNEVVTVLREQISPTSNEAVTKQKVTLYTESGGNAVELPQGKAVLVENYNIGSSIVSSKDPQKGKVKGHVPTYQLDFTSDDVWYQVQRANGQQGWVLGKFLTEM